MLFSKFVSRAARLRLLNHQNGYSGGLVRFRSGRYQAGQSRSVQGARLSLVCLPAHKINRVIKGYDGHQGTFG